MLIQTALKGRFDALYQKRERFPPPVSRKLEFYHTEFAKR